jgi:type II secretory pathway component GspD/PulD (secretin)
VRDADGRIILHSSDTTALDVFEELLEDLRPPSKDYAVFKLEYASASWVVLQLEDFFEENEDDNRNRFPFFFFFDEQPETKQSLGLADRRPIRFISDIDTNTIIVRNATNDQLVTVRELIELYDIREPVNREKSRHTKLVAIRYSKASVIADQVKDVFRDLLSGNDKAFQQQNAPNQQRQRSDSGGIFAQGLAFGDGDAATQSDTRASFQGKLSLGVDDTTNTLLVSTEGETLMKLVVAMIEDLDRAAQPADNVRIVRLRPGSNYGEIRNALRDTFGLPQQGPPPAGAAATPPNASSEAPAQKPAAPPEGEPVESEGT